MLENPLNQGYARLRTHTIPIMQHQIFIRSKNDAIQPK